MSLVLIAPPAVEPVTVDDLTELLAYGPASGLDATTLSLLTARLVPLIAAARAACEDYLGQALITQTWELRLDGFPGYDTRYNRSGSGYPQIWIPKPPFQEIVSFQYVDVGGILQTMQEDTSYGVSDPAFYSYQLDAGSQVRPARVLPAYARPWPPTRMVANNVILRFIAGYGDAGSDVPPPILAAIRFLAQWFYEQGAMQDAALPTVVTRLLDPYRNLIS